MNGSRYLGSVKSAWKPSLIRVPFHVKNHYSINSNPLVFVMYMVLWNWWFGHYVPQAESWFEKFNIVFHVFHKFFNPLTICNNLRYVYYLGIKVFYLNNLWKIWNLSSKSSPIPQISPKIGKICKHSLKIVSSNTNFNVP